MSDNIYSEPWIYPECNWEMGGTEESATFAERLEKELGLDK